MRRRRQTRIVATLGPASPDAESISKLFVAGADVFRINMSHTSHERMRELVRMIRGVEAPSIAFEPYFWTEGFGLTLKAVGFLPLLGNPELLAGEDVSAGLLRWEHEDGIGTAVALNHRIPIPRLRKAAA